MKKTSLIPALLFAVSLPVCLGGCGKAEPYRHDSFTFDTFVSFAIYETSEGISAEEVCTGAVGMLNELDDTLSRTKADSEISKINKNAGSGKVTVDTSTYNLLKSCTELSRLTDGAFDITLGDISDMGASVRKTRLMPDSDELKNSQESIVTATLNLMMKYCCLLYRRRLLARSRCGGKGLRYGYA